MTNLLTVGAQAYRRVCAVLILAAWLCPARGQDEPAIWTAAVPESRWGYARPVVLDLVTGQLLPPPAGLQQAKDTAEYMRRLATAGDAEFRHADGHGGLLLASGKGALLGPDPGVRLGQTPPAVRVGQLPELSLRPAVAGDHALAVTRDGRIVLLHVEAVSQDEMRLCGFVVPEGAAPLPEALLERFRQHVTAAHEARTRVTSGVTTLARLSGPTPVGFSVAKGTVVPVPAPPTDYRESRRSQENYLVTAVRPVADVVYECWVKRPALYFPNVKAAVLGKGNLAELTGRDLSQPRPPAGRLAAFGEAAEPFSRLLLMTPKQTWVLLRVESWTENDITFRWIHQPNGTGIFPRVDGLAEERTYVPPAPQVAAQDERTRALVRLATGSQGMTDEQAEAEFKRRLAEGADVNATDGDGMTALGWAALWGPKRLVELLVEGGANIDTSCALHCAASRGDLAIFQYLLAQGADPRQRASRTKESVLESAVRSRQPNPEIIRILRDLGAADSLWGAAQAGDLVAVQRYLAAGTDVNAWSEGGMTPLHLAVQGGSAEACKALLAAGADLRRGMRGKGVTPLELAVSQRKGAIVSVLLQSAPDEVILPALYAAVAKGDVKTTGELLAALKNPAAALDATRDLQAYRDADDKVAGNALVHFGTILANLKDPEVLALLEQSGLKLPLWAAARFGRMERVKELLAAGTPVDQPASVTMDYMPDTPLMFAVGNVQTEAVRLLLERGADVNAKAKRRDLATPLHDAARLGLPEIARLLVSKGADVTARTGIGEETPLELAVRNQDEATASVLLGAGADPNVNVATKDQHGKRLDVPLWKLAKDPELVRLLKSRGAR